MTHRRGFLAALAGGAAVAWGAKSSYRIGITTNTRGGWEKDVFRSFREAHEVGYRNVESFIHYFVDYWDKPGELKQKLDEIGVSFVTISNGGPLEMHFEDPTRHRKIIDDHVKLARFIRQFGCSHLKINLGPRRPEGTTEEDLKHIADVLEKLGRRLTAEGVKLAPHAHMWSQFENRREIDYVLGHTEPKHVWFVLDTGHITLAGIDPVELTRTLGHRIVEFHLKDTKPEWKGGAKQRLERPDMMNDPPFFELGHGGVDFPAIREHLDSIGWQGYWTVELDSSPFIGPKASARKSFEYLKAMKLPEQSFARRS
jgi:inosose dehydratase